MSLFTFFSSKTKIENSSFKNKGSILLSLGTLLILFLCSSMGSAQTVVTVGGGVSVTCPATPTATWTTPPTGVTFSNWSRGAGVSCGSAANGLSGSGFNTASAAASFAANKYYSVTITAAATHSFTLNSVVWGTAVSSGGAGFDVQYSNNGGPLTALGTPGQTNTTSNTFTGTVSVNPGTSIILYLIPSGTGAAGTTVRWVNGSTITVTAVANFTSAQNGDWNTASTWVQNAVPTAGSKVTVAHNVTLASALTNTGTVTVNSGASLAVAATYTNNGTTTINGSFQINQSGFATGNNFVYGAGANLIYNNTSGTYGAINASHNYWPASNGPTNVSLTGAGGINLAVSRVVTNYTTVAGTALSSGASLTVNGTLQMNAGSYFANSPTYGSSSTLRYNTGGTYGRAGEWSTTSGAGYPANVQVSNNTTIDPGNAGTGTPLQLSGNLTIDAGSAIYMDYGGNNMTVPLIINGNLVLNGSLSGSQASGGDIKVRGNWTSTGSFFPNARAVFFDGASGTQTITKASGQTFAYLIIDKAAGDVALANDITVTQTATLTNGVVTTGSNKVIIASGGSVARTNGHVAGFLQKAIGTGSPTVSFEIGGATNYRPVTVAFNNVTAGGNLTASVSQAAGPHPNLATSDINNTLRLDRYFTLTNAGTAFTSYDATFNYVAGDVINGADPLNFIAGKWNGSSWSSPTVGTKTATSTQITGEASFSDFAFGQSNATPILSANTLAGFGNICINTVAGPNTFTITGTALTTADVTVASLNGYSFSTDDITYTASLNISQPGGSFSQLIYVKFSPTAVQSYDGNIVVGGGGASNVNVAVTGSGINTAPSVATAAATGVTANEATIPGAISDIGCSAISAYGVEYSTTNGFANGTGTLAPGSNISGNIFSVGISGLSSGTTYYYHAYATNAGGPAYSAQGSFTTVTPTLSGSALTSFGNVCTGLTAGPNTFTITGTNLTTADVTVAALNGFSYSTDDITYTASLSISQPGGSFSQLVYVKFSPTLVQSYDGNIVLGGGGAANFNEAASGSGVNTAPSVTTGGSSSITQVAVTLAGTITADGCTGVTAYGIEYSTTNGFANGSGTQEAANNLSAGNFSVAISGLNANTTYYYKAYATNAGGTSYGSQQSFTTAGLDAPVATAATDIAQTSFTANWNAVTGATSYALDVATSSSFTFASTVASEPFENALSIFTGAGGAFYTGSSATGDRPATSTFAAAGTYGYGITNGSVTITSGNINTSTVTGAQLSFKLASFSIASTGNGADVADIVTVEVSPNGGTNYFSTVRVLGNSNAYWAYDATGVAATTYDGNASPVDFAPAGGGSRTTDGYSTITVTGLPLSSNMRIRITMLNNATAERWIIDDLQVTGTASTILPAYNNLSVAGTSQSVTGLTSNTTYYYRVRAVSASSTSANSNTITAQTCQAAVLGTTQTNVSCNGGTNGAIDLTITGGTAPIAVSWTGPGGFTATTDDISGLAAGQYDVTVTSNTGCPATTSVTITEPAALSAVLSGTPTICEGESANITVTITGGTAPYSVTYNDGVGNTTVGSLALGANSIPVSPTGTTNYSLVAITDNASCTGSISGTATVTVNPNFTITASAGANGSISPNGVTTLSCNGTGDQTYTITADQCFSIADVIVDGVSQGAVGTYTFTDVAANHTISATFVQNTFTITVTAGANGGITPGTGSVNCGDDAVYTITPNACYHVVDVLVDGVSQGAITTYTFTNVQATHTISASFAINAALLAPVVSGPVNVCQYIGTGDPVTYTFNTAGATSYSYVLPPFTTLVGNTANSITLNFLAGFEGSPNKQIRVTALSACGNSPMTIYYLAAQKPITPQPITASSSNVCAVIGTPGTITYTINAIVGATSYVWTNPAGTTIAHPNGPGINDTTVTLSFSNAFNNSTLTVQAANGCGTSNARSFTITRSNPSTPALITGPTNVCQHILPGGTGAVYKINTVVNATSYNWTVTPGTAIVTHPNGAGAMDTVINVTFQAGFTTGTITVSATNGCGTSSVRSLSLSKLNPSTPGVIDVINTVSCPNREYSYTIASVPANATSLVWTIPPGATLVSQSPAGPLPTSITVSYPATSVTGNVTVQALNNCGSSTTRVNAVKLPACSEDKGTFTKGATTTTTVQPLQVTVFPNPTVSDFKVQVITAGRETVKARILDMQGRAIRTLTVLPYQTTNIGSDLKAGSYILEVRQGGEVKTTKLLKF